MTLKEIRQAVPQGVALEARVHVQLETVASKFTREQKPYCELTLADAADRMTLRVWSDSPNFKACDSMQSGDFVEITGEFYQHQQYGLDARHWKSRSLTAEEQGAYFCKARPRSAQSRQPIEIHRRDHRRDPRSAALRALLPSSSRSTGRVFATPPVRAPIITRAAAACSSTPPR